MSSIAAEQDDLFSISQASIPLKAKEPKEGWTCWLVYTDARPEKGTAGRDRVEIGICRAIGGYAARADVCLPCLPVGFSGHAIHKTIHLDGLVSLQEAERRAVMQSIEFLRHDETLSLKRRGRLIHLLELGECRVEACER